MVRGEEGVVKNWGSWLRAPPRRAERQTQSKWLREEKDDTWESRIGVDSNYQRDSGGDYSKKGKEIIVVSDYRERVATEYRDESNRSLAITGANLKGYSTTSNILYDENTEENDSIQLENNKWRRSTADGSGLMEIEMGHQNSVSHLGLNRGVVVNYIDSGSNGNTEDRDSKNEQMAGTAMQSRQSL